MANLEHFQDRIEAIAAFDHLWDQEMPWILAFTGFSGQGKSTLLDWLEANRCKPWGIPYALIGVGEFAADLGQALTSLLEQPAIRAGLPAGSVQKYGRERDAILEKLQSERLSITQSQVMENAAGGEQSMRADVAQAVRAQERQAEKRLAEAWQNCLAQFKEDQRIVFLLDNYDAFQDKVSLEDLQFFWGVIDRAHLWLPGLRVVLACREEIRHQNDLRILQNGLGGRDLEPLSPADSAALLQALGVDDPGFQEAVYQRLAQGHPLVTRFAAEAWRDTPSGIPAEEVPSLTSSDVAVEWVQGRILDRLTGPLKEAVRWSALLRWFYAGGLKAILGIDLSADDFQTLTHYSFVIHPRIEPKYWACHDLVRQVQIAYLQRSDPDRFKTIHSQAAAYYVAQGNGLEALYHRFFFETDAAFEEWEKQESEAAFHFDHPTWSALMEIGLASEMALNAFRQANMFYRAGRRHYYRNEWEKTWGFYQQALGLFRAVGSKLGEANVLAAQARIILLTDDPITAEKHLNQAIALRRAIGSLYGEGADCGNFAITLINAGYTEKSREYALRARDIFVQIDLPQVVEIMDRIIKACEEE
jgi:hypothetical protein